MDRPILFSAPMVRAILAGRKFQTRRIIKPQPTGRIDPLISFNHGRMEIAFGPDMRDRNGGPSWWRPLAQAGDRLWVREAWAPLSALTHGDPGSQALIDGGFYRADEGTVEGEIRRWHPSIHMPRRASRLTLFVSDVKIQQLQDISEEDAIAEGVEPLHSGWFPYGLSTFMTTFVGDREVPAQYCEKARDSFHLLWDHINGEGAWALNPWVSVTTFSPMAINIDKAPLLRAA